jgi:hypothetical protein
VFLQKKEDELGALSEIPSQLWASSATLLPPEKMILV